MAYPARRSCRYPSTIRSVLHAQRLGFGQSTSGLQHRQARTVSLHLFIICYLAVDSIISCVQLVWSTGTNNPAAWAEFLNKLRDGVLSAFESAVIQREEDVRRSEGQRQMPGWNFCTFFILKVRNDDNCSLVPSIN